MSKSYTCELCKKDFNRKCDLTKHQNRKTPCVKVVKIPQVQNIQTKIDLSNIFKFCLDLLRDSEHLIGDKALRTLAYLLNLKLLEPKFNAEIAIDSYNYDFSEYDNSIAELHKNKLLNFARFSNIAKENEENIPTIMNHLWNEILSVHPITKIIFAKGKGFDIQNQSTYKKLINKLNSFNFENTDEDILGEAYEEVIKDVMTGKTLGQFFTPSKVKQMMIKIIDPQIKNDGTIETIFDPAMGTGGFLISSLRHLMHQSKTRNIKLDWKFISSEGLGGREAEPDTYQLAVSNMLISSGHMFNVLENGDSIRKPITNKYDIILANPPFGIDGLIYNEIKHTLRDEYMPIKSNSAVPLFLQAIIYMLKIGGRCAVVLPYGQEMQSKKTNLPTIREYLMKTCDLKDVIYLPSGIFTHTTVKTCILHFVKKIEGADALNFSSTSTKTGDETDRIYKFVDEHQTTSVKFYEYNSETENKTLLVEVPMEYIARNDYSLNYTSYYTNQSNPVNKITKTLGELCSFKSGKQLSKSKFIPGIYPVIGGGQKPVGLHNKFNKEKNTILCSSSGTAGFISRYETEVWASDCFSIHSKDKNVLNEDYLYFYLKSIQESIFKLQTGTAQPHIYAKTIENLNIPVIPLQAQEEISNQINDCNAKIVKLQEEIEEIKNRAQITIVEFINANK